MRRMILVVPVIATGSGGHSVQDLCLGQHAWSEGHIWSEGHAWSEDVDFFSEHTASVSL